MKKILSLAMAAVAVMVSSCGSNNLRFAWLDNPTDEPITVTVDGKAYELGPKEYVEIPKFPKGDHTMQLGAGDAVNFNTGELFSIVLNPTRSTYVIAVEEYGVGRASTDDWVDVEIDGKKYTGPFEVIDGDVMFDCRVNYKLDEDFPNTIETSASGTVKKNKVFRKDDFLSYYRREYR